MFAPLVPIKIASIYDGDLPKRMAKCSVDMFAALRGVTSELAASDNALVLSDLFRSYEMQKQSNLDFINKKKKAFSPPPGGSFHEAGRAFDLDLDKIKEMGLAQFWVVAKKHGLLPIISEPKAGVSESWHFDCRGSHARVYDYYAAGRGTNFKAYTAAAASAIVSIGQKVDALGEDARPGYIQSGLIRLGLEIGNLDGHLGQRSADALRALGIDPSSGLDNVAMLVGEKLRAAFPNEYAAPDVIAAMPRISRVGEDA